MAVITGFVLKRSEKPAETSIKQILLDQLKTTHNKKEWFVPLSVAVEGLTPEQAMWQDKSGNHSVGQLARHITFWNEQELAKFNGTKPEAFSGNNDETFNSFDKNSWPETVKRLEKVLSDWEKAIETADDAKLKDWYNDISHMSTHNAYHTGQMIFVRKLQGAWNPEKGVK